MIRIEAFPPKPKHWLSSRYDWRIYVDGMIYAAGRGTYDRASHEYNQELVALALTFGSKICFGMVAAD